MINIVVELSKYVILTLMIVYTVLCYYLVVGKHASDRKGLLRSQITLTFFLDFTAFVVIFLKTFDFKVVIVLCRNDDIFCCDPYFIPQNL